jgi:hypothetical protein
MICAVPTTAACAFQPGCSRGRRSASKNTGEEAQRSSMIELPFDGIHALRKKQTVTYVSDRTNNLAPIENGER